MIEHSDSLWWNSERTGAPPTTKVAGRLKFTLQIAHELRKLVRLKRREFSGMIHWLTINNHHPSNPQQPIQQPYVKRTSKIVAKYLWANWIQNQYFTNLK